VRAVKVGRLQTNCYLVDDGAGGVLVVDPGAEPARILAAVGERPVSLVLTTHAHFDHVGALDELVARSAGGWLCMADEWAAFEQTCFEGARMFGVPVEVAARPARLLADGDEVAAGELRLRVLACPGHSVGGATFVDDAHGLAFTGDTLFAGSAGRTDLLGGDECALAASLARLAQLPPATRVLPGHGATSTIALELKTNPYLSGYASA
jgi:glyoxylase-like metal-dependent hydrolase (beta-lactamase superfamily II)